LADKHQVPDLETGAGGVRGEGTMVRSGTSDAADDQQSLGGLVALALKDFSQLLRYEITLAKSELRVDVRRVAIAGAFFGFVAFVGCIILVLLCFAYAYGLNAVGVPGGLWGAFLWVVLTLAVFAVIAGLLALYVVRRVTGMRLTRKTVIDDIGMLRRGGSADSGSGRDSVPAGAPAAEIPARRLPR
jgi:hypothetical protein